MEIRNDSEYEVELNLKDMLFHVLYRWRSILLVTLVCALVLGGHQFMSLRSSQNKADLSEEEQASLLSDEVSLTSYKSQAESLTKQLEDLSRYQAESVYFRLDSQSVWTASAKFVVKVDPSVLAALPQVDSLRIGCAGCSMGAYRAWMLSALSDRIRCGAAICWMNTADHQLTLRHGRGENGGFANCLPGLRRWLDYPHVASLACPKPMLFINGRQDKLFPVEGVEKAFGVMHDVWKSQLADSQLETELWDIPHSCGLEAQQRILEFLDKTLKRK